MADHFIRKITDTLKDSYVFTAGELLKFSEAYDEVVKGRMYTDEYKAAERTRIARERREYVDASAAVLRGKVKAILDEEKASVTKQLTANRPTEAQLNTLTMLRTLKKLSQSEFNAYADTLKGCYLNEKALSEIAQDHALVPYPFVPLDQQMKKIDSFEKLLKGVEYYSGEEDISRWGNDIRGGGNGVPYYAQLLMHDCDEIISQYESGKFEATVTPKTLSPMEQLTRLKEDHPDYVAQVDAFIDKNKQSLANEMFASQLQEFITNINELDKPKED